MSSYLDWFVYWNDPALKGMLTELVIPPGNRDSLFRLSRISEGSGSIEVHERIQKPVAPEIQELKTEPEMNLNDRGSDELDVDLAGITLQVFGGPGGSVTYPWMPRPYGPMMKADVIPFFSYGRGVSFCMISFPDHVD